MRLVVIRGPDQKQDHLFSYVSPKGECQPFIRPLVDQVLKEMSQQFGKLYSGRESLSIPRFSVKIPGPRCLRIAGSCPKAARRTAARRSAKARNRI